ncbi:site-specific integrase [Tamlana sp. I1]|uniref:site-specific integrase n=1 Tax=Tamlana sp. I1 TaxID=2762061 RepID=UPI00188F0459|nr:site-specific integrase [Tamlana sp. I1]
MATIAFAYRSTKKEANIQVRFVYQLEGFKSRKSIYAPTKFEVLNAFWDKYQSGTKFSGTNKDLALKLDTLKKELSEHILDAYKSVKDKSIINKEWLLQNVHEYYNPPQPEIENVIPESIIEYIDFYKKDRGSDLSLNAVKKWGVIKNKLIRFEASQGKRFILSEVTSSFKNKFLDFYIENQYSINTTQREFAYIKSLCKHARLKGLDISPETEGLSIKKERFKKPYLTFKELEKIQKLEYLSESLDNARDWLLISCYTAQRISDFMRFDKSMIRYENEVPVIEFRQQKTQKETIVPLLPQVINIINKREGEFPRRISDQKYNESIKLVCKEAGINDLMKGKKRICVAPEGVKPKKHHFRDLPGEFEKWELISSHCGRRSFATNYYTKLPTSYLISITNHSTEAQFLSYIQKPKKELVFDAYKQLLNV